MFQVNKSGNTHFIKKVIHQSVTYEEDELMNKVLRWFMNIEGDQD